MLVSSVIGNLASRRRVGALACAAVIGGLMVAATPAQAWWRGGVWIGVPPIVVGAPAYYPAYPYYYPPYYPYAYPPAYYPPPPAYPQSQAQPAPQSQGAQSQAQASHQQVAYGSTCYAGVYVCAAPGNTPVNAGCSCPGIGAPSYGVVR